MSFTPISDAIDSLATDWSLKKFDEFLRLLDATPVGIFALGVPEELKGQTVDFAPAGVGLASSSHGGKSRIMAFADPQEFMRKHGRKCNGEMPGSEVFKVVLHNPDCGGILINSALSESSFPVEREDIERFIRLKSEGVKPDVHNHAWWRRWLKI